MKMLDKIKKAIKKSAPRKHELISIKDSPPKRTEFDTNAGPSSLDVALTRLKKKGVRVLDFWRDNGRWTIKVMA